MVCRYRRIHRLHTARHDGVQSADVSYDDGGSGHHVASRGGNGKLEATKPKHADRQSDDCDYDKPEADHDYHPRLFRSEFHSTGGSPVFSLAKEALISCKLASASIDPVSDCGSSNEAYVASM